MLYNQKNPHGGDVYSEQITLDFSSNTNPLGTPPGVVAAIRAAAAQVRQIGRKRHCRHFVLSERFRAFAETVSQAAKKPRSKTGADSSESMTQGTRRPCQLIKKEQVPARQEM